MDFKQFITSFGYRNRIAKQFERYENIQPPSNPSPSYIQKLVTRILVPEESSFAIKELEMIGKPAGPALLAALDDPQYRQVKQDDSRSKQPLDIVLGLLVPVQPEQVVKVATELIKSESSQVRKIAAIHVTHTGLDDVGPLLKRLLSDDDFYVRSYAAMGLERALKNGRLSVALREQAYSLLLEQCTVAWRLAGNKSARVLIELDRARAEADLADPAILSPDNPNLKSILESCNRESILLPADLLRTIFEDLLPRIVGKNPYPYQYVLGEAIELLATCLPTAELRTLIERAIATQHERVIESAANADAKIAGVDHALQFVFDRIRTVGYEDLTPPQRVVYLASVFDVEICNGGIMQFFGNSSGDYVADTLDSLQQLDHTESVAALSHAMDAVGPLARETDRDMRMEAFAGRFDELQIVFDLLEKAYYKANSDLRAKIMLFAAEHAEDFR